MATIVTRSGKGSALTHTEMDANFNNLNTDKIESTLAADLNTNDNAIKNTGVNGYVEIANRTQITQNVANNLLQLENQNDSGLGLSIIAGNSDQGTYGSLAILSVADKDSNLRFIVKASGEVVVYDNLSVDSLLISNATSTQAQITTLTSGHDLNIKTNGGTLSLNSLNWPASDGTTGQFLKTDGAGNLSFATVSTTAIDNVVEDTSPQLGGTLDCNGQLIDDASRDYLILGDNNAPSASDFDSFSASGTRVHGVVTISDIDGTQESNRYHSNPTLSKFQLTADRNDSNSRWRMNYVEGVLEMDGFDSHDGAGSNTTGFGKGHHGMFVSAMVRNAGTQGTGQSEDTVITQVRGITAAPQTAGGGPTVTVKDMRAFETQPNILTGDTIENMYGIHYSTTGGGTIGSVSHYSFYGAEQLATAYNQGGFQLPTFSVATLNTTSPAVLVPRNTGNMVYCSDESTGAQAVIWNGSNWVLLADPSTSIS